MKILSTIFYFFHSHRKTDRLTDGLKKQVLMGPSQGFERALTLVGITSIKLLTKTLAENVRWTSVDFRTDAIQHNRFRTWEILQTF
jgi:hypothetical protein